MKFVRRDAGLMPGAAPAIRRPSLRHVAVRPGSSSRSVRAIAGFVAGSGWRWHQSLLNTTIDRTCCVRCNSAMSAVFEIGFHWSPASTTSSPTIGAIEDAPACVATRIGTQRADIVNTSGVDEEHRTNRQQFHRLFDRIGRCAGDVRDDRDRLGRVMSVQQRGLANVPPAENADVQSQAFRCQLASALLALGRAESAEPLPGRNQGMSNCFCREQAALRAWLSRMDRCLRIVGDEWRLCSACFVADAADHEGGERRGRSGFNVLSGSAARRLRAPRCNSRQKMSPARAS